MVIQTTTIGLIHTKYVLSELCKQFIQNYITFKTFRIMGCKIKSVNKILVISFFIALTIFIVTTIVSIKINGDGACFNILNAFNTLATSYIVAYGVYYLTVEKSIRYHQKEQKYIKKDLLLKIRHMIINICEELNIDKDLSVDKLQCTLQYTKEKEWESVMLKSESTCEFTIKLFASGLTFNKDELDVLYNVYQTVSSLAVFGYDSRDKRVVIDTIIQMQNVSNRIDAICAVIDVD